MHSINASVLSIEFQQGRSLQRSRLNYFVHLRERELLLSWCRGEYSVSLVATGSGMLFNAMYASTTACRGVHQPKGQSKEGNGVSPGPETMMVDSMSKF